MAIRVIGWLLDPLVGFNATHKPIGLDEDKNIILNNNRFDPWEIPGLLSHTGKEAVWTSKEVFLDEAVVYNNFYVNNIIDGEDQDTLQQQWMEFFSGGPLPWEKQT